MLQVIRARQFAQQGNLANLEDLRAQLTRRLALLVMAASGLAMWLTLPQEPFSIVAFSLLAALLGLGVGVQALVDPHPRLAQHLLVWGLSAGLLVGMWLFADPWLPFLGLLLTFVSAMLVSGGELLTAGAIAMAATWWTRDGSRVYPLPDLFTALLLGVALAWLVVRTLYTALQWAWSMQQRADDLLDQVRDRQAELSRVLKSSELANTLLRRTQHELVAARKQADEARRLKEQFAANISHELRTPLNLILGFSELMYLWPDVYGEISWPPNLRRAVYQIYRSSRHLLEMIDDILDLSRFEMVGFTLDKELAPLEPLLRDTAEIVADLFQSGSARLEIDIEPALPDLEMDRTRIRQVLLNLLNNALRFTEGGAVRLAARRANNEVVISVSDTGRGIPAGKLSHVFDEFYQVDLSLRRSHQGAGLGLAISKRFVQAHEGRIWAESQEGIGSTFFFTLPVPGHGSALPFPVKHPLEAQWPPPRSPILLVDRDPALAALIDRHIEAYPVVRVEDASRLAEAVLLHHPRAVIYNVPPGEQYSGEGLPSIPVPLIQCSLPSQAWVVSHLPVAACLTKPVTAQQLLAEIERLGYIHDVLIIDDDRGFGQLVEMFLKTTAQSFAVRQAYDGEDGLLAMRRQRPDLVLLDLAMPGVDGFQVLEQMQQDPALVKVPVVLLTATSYAESALTQPGSRMVIHRPDGLHPAEVLRCLGAIIEVLEPHYDEQSVPEDATS